MLIDRIILLLDRHLKSSSEVVVYPFPLTMCPDVITDKHWFKENILCLLSNAIKYSNGGNVTVKITHVTVPQQLSHDYPQSEADFGTLMPYSQPLSYIGSPDDDNNDDDDGGGDNGTVVTSDIPFVNDISANSHHQEKVSHAIASPTGVNCTCLSSEEEPSQLATACYAIIGADAQPVKTDSSSSSPSSSETSMILITIEDGGIGIPEGVRGELFQPFKQVQRLAGGTGLGLYSLSNRIRALKGMRGVKSRHDGKQGSVFWFAIPYRPDIDHASCNTRRSSIVTTPKISSRKDSMSIDVTSTSHTTATYPSIDSTSPVARLVSAFPMYTSTPATKQGFQFLVVDDSPSILKVITRALTNKKYHVVTADNGSAGLDRLIAGYDNQDFNVVLMDLQMPVMDGIVAVRRYRDFEAKKMEKVVAEESQSVPLRPQELFIIGMSANSDEHTKQCAFDAGMNAFLAKPFTIADLMPVLEHILVTATADE